VTQPTGFENNDFLNHVFKLLKALYGLRQTLNAWNERLNSFLLKNGFQRGTTDTTFFIKESNDNFILVQVYMDDIVFSSVNEVLCANFGKLMTSKFDMSMMGELTFFLELQIKQTPSGIFVHQGKYAKELVKKFGLENSKPMSTSMHPNSKLEKDENDKDVDEIRYRGMIRSLIF